MAKKRRQPTLFAMDDDAPVQSAAGAADAATPRTTPVDPGDAVPIKVEPSEMATSAGLEIAAQILTDSSEEPADELLGGPVHINLPDSLADKTVYVVDSLSLIFQVFHAIPEMTSPGGEPVGAVFGFCRDLVGLIAKKPDYLFFAWDVGSTTFRNELYSDYKAHRTEMPVDLRPQLGRIEQVLHAVGTPRLGCPNYEADDILALIAREVDARGGTCLLITSDKDCRQLITNRVKMLNLRKNLVLDAAGLMDDWGVRPDQVVDYQTLVGDPVDHVPGVPLIGPKIAKELLQKYDSLDNLYQHIDELAKGKRKENLIQHREQALVSRQLVRLNPDVPMRIDWNAGRCDRLDVQRLLPLFVELGFHSLANQARAAAPKSAAQWRADYQVVDTPVALDAFICQLAAQKQVAVDVVAEGKTARSARLIGLTFCWQAEQAWYLPLAGRAGEPVLDREATLAALCPLLESASLEKFGQDLKFEFVVLRAAGVRLAGVRFDAMLASYLLDAGERNHTLDELSQRLLEHRPQTLAECLGAAAPSELSSISPRKLAPFVCQAVDLVWRLRPLLLPKLAEAKLDRLFSTLEIPLIDVLAELEFNGIRLDLPRLAELSRQYGERMATLEVEIYAAAGQTFNIGSPKQLADVLFNQLKLPVVKKTKTGISTDAEVLEELATVHPLPAKIVEYRQFAKLKSTYVDVLPQLVLPETGRVHASFNQMVAATGRLSSSDPNLQNIPIRTETGREIRSAFIPGPEGWRLLAADYSQIELRVLAHFCGDAALRQAFDNDEDIHARVASQVYRVPLAEVTSTQRRVAKAVNFGVIYGQSPFGLAKALGISQAEAAQFIDAYFAGYPGIETFLNEILANCRQNGYVSTILGRRRTIRGVREAGEMRGGDPSNRQRNLSERTAINTVIQGSAADLIKMAMIAIQRQLDQQRLATRMLLQIHDELVFEAPPDELSRIAQLVVAEMAGVMPLSVPLKVDVKTGPTWADAEAM